MKRFAVFGHPVLHSLSPKIHQAFARQTGIALDYTAIECAPGDFASTLSAFSRNGGSLAENGAVSWQFENRGVITIDAADADTDELQLAAARAL